MFDVQHWQREQRGGNPDRALLVTFKYEAEEVNGEFKNVPYINIFIDKDNIVYRKATSEDFERFEDRWKAFLKNEEIPEDGTPISECPLANPANVASCKSVQIRTCEQLVETPDERLQRVRLVEFKYRVMDWLKGKEGASHLKEMRAEIEKLKAENALLKERFKEAGVQEPEKPKRRGRPRKVDENASTDS